MEFDYEFVDEKLIHKKKDHVELGIKIKGRSELLRLRFTQDELNDFGREIARCIVEADKQRQGSASASVIEDCRAAPGAQGTVTVMFTLGRGFEYYFALPVEKAEKLATEIQVSAAPLASGTVQ